MVQNGMPIHASYILKEKDMMTTPVTEGIPVEMPRNMMEKLTEQLVVSQEREIGRLVKLLEEKEGKIAT